MKFNLKKIFNSFTKKEVSENQREVDVKILKDIEKKYKEKKSKSYQKIEICDIENHSFKIGDKVICRSNEPYPIIVGKIIEFWDNEGKWSRPVPVVRNSRNGKKFNVHGIIKPYTKELMDVLKPLKPLEQWNYLAPKEVQYTQEEILKKEESFKKREKFLPNKK